ncbi:hypothetical protein [Histidinibacterium aquaticum]|uniref:Uncharacterized protein n=1 Tax=Histidinibacterium aquaticum TaxID=2613962 RepID=A0A5J5GIL9_9RHOB|nr:hypothetical protein [Histidinibacterium aquaticum]KAA9007880.1 hypothetical protein F3S47_10160 [Histidinibacterium aquaticum]
MPLAAREGRSWQAGPPPLFLHAPSGALSLDLDAPGGPPEVVRLTRLRINWIAELRRLRTALARIWILRERILEEEFGTGLEAVGPLRDQLNERVDHLAGLFGRAPDHWARHLQAARTAALDPAADPPEVPSQAGLTAFIGSWTGYARLAAEWPVVWLREDSYAPGLRRLAVDRVVIETAPASAPGDWRGTFMSLGRGLGPAACDLVTTLRGLGLHLVLWATAPLEDDGPWSALAQVADEVWDDGAPAAPRPVDLARAAASATQPWARDTMLVAFAEDILSEPLLPAILGQPHSYSTMIIGRDPDLPLEDLARRLAPRAPHIALGPGEADLTELLAASVLTLVPGESRLGPGEVRTLCLRAIAAGSVPVIAGTAPEPLPGVGLDAVWSWADLQRLQGLYRDPAARAARLGQLAEAVARVQAPAPPTLLAAPRTLVDLEESLARFREAKEGELRLLWSGPAPPVRLETGERLHRVAGAGLGAALPMMIRDVSGPWCAFPGRLPPEPTALARIACAAAGQDAAPVPFAQPDEAGAPQILAWAGRGPCGPEDEPALAATLRPGGDACAMLRPPVPPLAEAAP